MIDGKAVFAILPDQFTLDTMSADKTAGEKSRNYLRQVIVRWSKEGRIKRAGRGIYLKLPARVVIGLNWAQELPTARNESAHLPKHPNSAAILFNEPRPPKSSDNDK